MTKLITAEIKSGEYKGKQLEVRFGDGFRRSHMVLMDGKVLEHVSYVQIQVNPLSPAKLIIELHEIPEVER